MTRKDVIERLKLILETDKMTLDGFNTQHEPLENEIKALDAAIKGLEELQVHREAWMKVVSEIDQYTDIHSDGELYVKNFDVKKIIAEYRPKEGDAE